MIQYFILTFIPFLIIVSFDIFCGSRVILMKRFWKTIGVLGFATLLFDTFLTSIPIVLYNQEKISGLKIGTIPIEDFIYGFTFALTVFVVPSFIAYLQKNWKVILACSRPFSWINTAYPYLLAVFVLRGRVSIEDVLIVLFFLFPYNLLVYGINDIYDYETDRLNPRKNSIEGALVEPVYHKSIWWLTIALCVLFLPVMFYTGGWILLSLFLILILNAIFYSAPPFRFKGVPVFDSISSSLHFVFPAVIGVVIANHLYDSLHVLFAFFFWGIASHIIGAIPDIQYDKKAKISTVATLLGKKLAVIIAVLFYCLAGILLIAGNVPIIFILLLLPYCLNAASFFLDNRFSKLRPFRYFMYYNLFYGFVSTMYIIWRYIV